jgi:hypothetical protein
MALIRYLPRVPPVGNFRTYMYEEYKRIQGAIDSILEIATVLREFRSKDLRIEVGPPDSAGFGYRALRIKN